MPQVRRRRTAKELLQSSDEEKPDLPTPAGAEPPALTSGAVRAPGQEEIIMVPDDFESPRESMKELDPNASEYVPLDFGNLYHLDSGSDPSDVIAYIPISRSSSPERGPDGGVPVVVTAPVPVVVTAPVPVVVTVPMPFVTVNVLLVDAPAVPAETEAGTAPLSPPLPSDIVRLWRGVDYPNGLKPIQMIEGVVTSDNPYGDPPPQKDHQLVVHPEVDAHMAQHKEGRKKGLKTLLSPSQCRLIKLDFLEALDDYDDRSLTGELSMWRALEASRYCSNNPSYKEALADVNVAARLLISVRLVNCGPVHLKLKSWSVAAERSEEGEKVYFHNFKLVPPPASASRP